ncbi:palmitoyltransferase ZDHHC9/14/18 [Pancytospora epiphaga]|nr:palmitoyltransferase ZDHHC9/14/18 [Pancytospora epiphaga]
MEYEYSFKKNVIGRTILAWGILIKILLLLVWNIYSHLSIFMRVLCLLAITIYPMAFLKVAFSNPGRLKKNEKCPCGGCTRLSDGVIIKTYPEQYMRDIILPSSGQNRTFRQKMCTTCLIYKSNRTAHCSDCNFCLLEKDHHCFWVANCIGRNNYKQFLVFLFWSVVIFLLSGFASRDLFSVYFLIGYILSIFFYSLSFGLSLFFLYSVMLNLFGLTTREYLNGKKGCFIGLAKSWELFTRNRLAIIVRSDTV